MSGKKNYYSEGSKSSNESYQYYATKSDPPADQNTRQYEMGDLIQANAHPDYHPNCTAPPNQATQEEKRNTENERERSETYEARDQAREDAFQMLLDEKVTELGGKPAPLSEMLAAREEKDLEIYKVAIAYAKKGLKKWEELHGEELNREI